MTRLIDADALWQEIQVLKAIELDTVQTITNLITNAPTVQREGWVSVEDRLPEPWRENSIVSKEVWISYMDGEVRRYATAKFDLRSFICFASNRDVKVTHWQPLPAAPTDKE